MTTAVPRPACPRPHAALGTLTAEQESQLAAAVAAGDVAARDELIRRNLGLVHVIAHAYAGRGLEPDDLVGEGTLGLIRAAQDYDPAFGARFGTYAAHWIKQAIRAALTDTGATIRLSAHMVRLMSKWRQAERRLGWDVGFDEVASELGLSESQRAMVVRAMGTRQVGDFEGSAEPAGAECPSAAAERSDEAADLKARMAARMDERERLVITLRFGLDDGEPVTLAEVGRRLGVTKEWVRRIEARAVAKLK